MAEVQPRLLATDDAEGAAARVVDGAPGLGTFYEVVMSIMTYVRTYVCTYVNLRVHTNEGMGYSGGVE